MITVYWEDTCYGHASQVGGRSRSHVFGSLRLMATSTVGTQTMAFQGRWRELFKLRSCYAGISCNLGILSAIPMVLSTIQPTYNPTFEEFCAPPLSDVRHAMRLVEETETHVLVRLLLLLFLLLLGSRSSVTASGSSWGSTTSSGGTTGTTRWDGCELGRALGDQLSWLLE